MVLHLVNAICPQTAGLYGISKVVEITGSVRRQMSTCFGKEWNGVTPFLKESAQRVLVSAIIAINTPVSRRWFMNYA
jgi:hypothetical protein